MGLLLSVLITCVGVLEVIACYTHFRIGVAYNECKSNIRDVAKYYAVELRKHDLVFEGGPQNGGPSTSQQTLSELIQKRTVRTQEQQLQIEDSSGQVTPNMVNLKVPRNSICGTDSPTVQSLTTPEVDITEAIVEKIQELGNDQCFWSRKSPSPYPEKSGLEVVEKDFWRSRSPSPFPESKDSDSGVELIYTPNLKRTTELPLMETPELEETIWNQTPVLSPEPIEETSVYSKADLEVQTITESILKSQESDVLFGITEDAEDNETTKFDEAFLRSLDGVNKASKCDDRRRSFRKKRNSSSTSSRASRDEISRSLTSLDDLDDTDIKKITPLTEEDLETNEQNGHFIRSETVTSEKCESICSPVPEAKITSQEETLFQAKVGSTNTNQQESSKVTSNQEKGKTNLSFTEKVKDLEISVQLLVTVKGTNQGDKMEYVTTVSQDDQKSAKKSLGHSEEDSITKTTEEKSEFGNVKTSVTYGNSSSAPKESPQEDKSLKDLQISSQSLIHAERTLQDDVASTEAEFLKLYESFTELPKEEKDKFLKIIEQDISNKNIEIPKETVVTETTEMEQTETAISNNNENIIEKISQIDVAEEDVKKEMTETEKLLSSEIDTEEIPDLITEETLNTETEITNLEITPISSNKLSSEKEETTDTSLKTEKSTKSSEKQIETTKTENSSESSSTPSTVCVKPMRRASKTSFENATPGQNEDMFNRRLSKSDTSPKQASQAFWDAELLETPSQDNGLIQ